MTIIVMIEVMTFYIMFLYLSDIDRYGFMVMLGIGMVLMIGRNGWISVLAYVMIFPMFYGMIE